MGDITIEKADYIIAHYTDLLTLAERKALRHHVSTIKLEGTADGRLSRLYLKTG
ncbi:hypothetical protein [Mucilaginibacter lappiensis]|uniref:Uncharacterized protein n=1 Tax=Mucilaginibacter lappiensis TaxID=354630 RepID=A0A841JFM2_9SPHI|nr:hypothetical protein [Mucilaginibacter lappiensis]MBB6129727.1 hypothetical protein [Mucilaginibacter lappiensis]